MSLGVEAEDLSMPKLGTGLAVAIVTAAMVTGCMSGRSSLLATQGASGGAASSATESTQSSALTGSRLLGPGRALAVSGNRASTSLGPSTGLASGTALRLSTGLVSTRAAANLTPPSPSAGAARVSGAVAASTGALAAAGRTSLAITPTLAPASSVGASVAAVSQPLNVAAAARAGAATTPSKTTAAANVKLKAAGVGVSVHVGP